MRVALISLLVPAEDDPATPVGLLALAGKSLAARQVDLALGLGCERVICVAAGLDRQIVALQHRAEAAGAKFNLVTGPRPLLGMIGSGDELVGFAEGLLPAAEDAVTALARAPGILVLPVEKGVAAGFERIDLNHAWAGMFAMPGRLVERLAELPPDCDAVSALLRIALQGRVRERILPDAVLADDRWAMIQSRGQVEALEPAWFRRQVAAPSLFAPGRALARSAMGMLGGRLLGRGFRPVVFSLGGVAIAAAGLGAAWLGRDVAGILLCAAGWLVLECGAALRPIARTGSGTADRPGRLAPVPGWLVDLCLAGVLVLALGRALPESASQAAILLGLVRLAERLIARKWAEFLQDRALLAALLAASAAYGVLLPAMETLSLLLLAALLGLAGRETRLTQT